MQSKTFSGGTQLGKLALGPSQSLKGYSGATLLEETPLSSHKKHSHSTLSS